MKMPTQTHPWVDFPSGAPIDCGYYWCPACGTFCVDPQESDGRVEFYIVGSDGATFTNAEPPWPR